MTDWPETAPHRSRKGRRRWCGGHPGREHVRVIRLSRRGQHWQQGTDPVCRWTERHHWVFTLTHRYWVGTGTFFWSCLHEVGCDRCGKVLLSSGVGRACPDYHDRPAP